MGKYKQDTCKEFQELAMAIVCQAVKDYRIALAHGKTSDRSPSPSVLELERFFRSDWFDVMSDIDGERLIHTIRHGLKSF